MVKVILSRKYGNYETLGTLIVFFDHELIFTCHTIELPWLNNAHNVSCIPEGIYDVEKYDSPNKGMVFWIKDVPDRDGILIHKGNYATGKKVDTKGCVIVGSSFEDINADGNLDVIESTKTLNRLLGMLPSNFKIHIL
jgi:hypothetical protein